MSHVTVTCEILGSYLQQPHQRYVFSGHFKAEPNSQAKAYKHKKILCLGFWSNLSDSVETDKTLLPCSARETDISVGQAGTNA